MSAAHQQSAISSSAGNDDEHFSNSLTANTADKDMEKHSAAVQSENSANAQPNDHFADYNEAGLKRQLGQRQLAMISIGAAIGTGIFLGTGQALQSGGPLGLLLGYIVIATVVTSVLCCAGELVSFLPVSGGHLTLSGRFVDHSFAAAASWNYWICWSLVISAELSAAAVLVQFWNQSINPGVWIAIFLVWILFVNAFGVKWFGEAEFYFSSLKVITIVGLIIVSIVITAGGGPTGQSIGFRFWRNPGPFVQFKDIGGANGRFLGFFAVLQQAAFSQIGSGKFTVTDVMHHMCQKIADNVIRTTIAGVEMLALAAAETKSPRRALPLALNTVWIRISLFYVTSVFMIGLIVSSSEPRLGLEQRTGAASPFVIAISDAGISALPSVVNAAILVSAISAGCADLFTASRALHSLSRKKMAPSWFLYTTPHGIPLPALIMSWLMGFLSFLSVSNGSSKAFGFFINLTSISGVITWMVIAITYIRFDSGLRAQKLDRKSMLPWRVPGNVTIFMAWWVVLIIFCVILFSGWTSLRSPFDASGFFSTYTPVIWFVLFFAGFKLFWRTSFIRASQMDFVTGLAEIEQDEQEWKLRDEIERPSTRIGRLKRWWNS